MHFSVYYSRQTLPLLTLTLLCRPRLAILAALTLAEVVADHPELETLAVVLTTAGPLAGAALAVALLKHLFA